MDSGADHGGMIIFALILVLAVAGLIVRLSTESDMSERDRRHWWPGTR